MSGNQLAKFFATVGFKVDTSEFDKAVKKVKKDVAGISKSVQSSTVAKQARSMRQNLRFEEQKAQYRGQEEAAMLKQAAFLNKEDTYKKKGIALREKASSFAERLRNTESAQALRNIQAKRTAAKIAEQASTKELSNMRDFYRKQEADGAKVHSQALSDNIKLSQAKVKAAAMAEKFRNSESVKVLRNIQAKRQQAVRGEIGSAKELAAMNTHYRKQEQAYDKLHQQALRENIRLEQRRTKEANRRTALQQRGARSSLDPMTTGAVGGMTARGAVGGLAAGAFAQQSFRTAQFSAAREPQFEFLTGSKEKAKEQIQFIDKEVDRLSLNLGQANEQYKNLLAAGGDALGIGQTQKLFTSFAELSTMLGTSVDQQNRGLRAFSQMASKSQVMAEELKGQLAENLPGAVKMFADALTGGDTTKLFKLMEDGKIGLEELQKVIDHMASIVDPELVNKMANTPAKKFEKMRTAWVRMLEATNDAGILNLMVKTFEEMTDVLEDLARWVRLNKEGFETFGKVVGRTWLVIKTAIQMLLPYWKEILALFAAAKLWAIGAAILKLSGVTLTLGTSVAILAKAVGGLMLRLFLVPLLIAGAVAALLDLNDAVNGKNSFFKDWAKDDQWYSGFAKFVLLLADAVEYSKELLTSGAVELFGRLTGNKELVAYAQESREKATKRSAALKEEINPSDNMQHLLDSTMTNMRRSIAPLFALEVIEHIRAGVTQISSDQSPQPNPQRSMFGQGAQGQGVIALPSQSPQSTQVNNITVHAPTREGGEIARQVAQALPNYVRDK